MTVCADEPGSVFAKSSTWRWRPRRLTSDGPESSSKRTTSWMRTGPRGEGTSAWAIPSASRRYYASARTCTSYCSPPS